MAVSSLVRGLSWLAAGCGAAALTVSCSIDFDRDRLAPGGSSPSGSGGGAQDAAHGTGSGLGLSIVRRIANAHGATVTLGEGADGRGLAVDVRFPSATATPTLTGLPAPGSHTPS